MADFSTELYKSSIPVSILLFRLFFAGSNFAFHHFSLPSYSCQSIPDLHPKRLRQRGQLRAGSPDSGCNTQNRRLKKWQT